MPAVESRLGEDNKGHQLLKKMGKNVLDLLTIAGKLTQRLPLNHIFTPYGEHNFW